LIKKNIPNLFTCANLFCGCLGIVFAFQGNLVWTAYMVGIAAVMDFLDGFVARLLNVHSEIGKQLDSLADMVTFGVVPGMVMYHLLKLAVVKHIDMEVFSPEGNSHMNVDELMQGGAYIPFVGFLITVFSAVRLAKFNIDTRQTDSFIGVPTPANSILICSLPLILSASGHEGWTIYPPGQATTLGAQFDHHMITNTLLNPWFLMGLTLVMSCLLIAELPLFALKFKNFKWADNKIRYIFLALCLAVLIIFKYVGIPFIIVLYVVMSVIHNIANRKTT
jgi:CDP-diacylglycerol---serine O-phosphatidyltransferase